MLNFISFVIDAVFSVFDGALDYVINIITSSIFEAIPKLKELFRGLDFGGLDEFLMGPFQELRGNVTRSIDTISNELGLQRLNAVREVNAYWQANVLSTAHTKKTDFLATSSQDILIDFTCAPGYYPVVGKYC